MVSNHSFRATSITACLQNGGTRPPRDPEALRPCAGEYIRSERAAAERRMTGVPIAPPLPNQLQEFNYLRRGATWRSGYATVCKTVYPGSIPGVASNKTKDLAVMARLDPFQVSRMPA
jgi:hypothetical protein